jgi:SAM-dependent methyltransferase
MRQNQDIRTVQAFGDEWVRFNQSELSEIERDRLFGLYFDIFPWDELPQGAHGFDLGCGSGRWAMCVAPRVGELHCIDASVRALNVAEKNLRQWQNCRFHHGSVDEIPLADASMDFGYSLGVLHHIPDTEAGLRCCVAKLRPGAPFLLYLYYSLENRPWWYRQVWRSSNAMRKVVSRTPYRLRYALSQALAATVYLPLARTSLFVERVGLDPSSIPLSFYRHRSFYTMRTDALDRFGTRLEKRFSQGEIEEMMRSAGLERIRFSPHAPYWCAIGYRTR